MCVGGLSTRSVSFRPRFSKRRKSLGLVTAATLLLSGFVDPRSCPRFSTRCGLTRASAFFRNASGAQTDLTYVLTSETLYFCVRDGAKASSQRNSAVLAAWAGQVCTLQPLPQEVNVARSKAAAPCRLRGQAENLLWEA